jgi:hypothetical protein
MRRVRPQQAGNYIAEYDIFLRLLDERQATAERAENDASPSPWKFGS